MAMEEFLRSTKEVLKDLNSVSEVHVVIGNEACDLDSAVSALAYAFFLHKTCDSSTCIYLPLLNISQSQYRLRTEITYFLGTQGISAELLTFRDQVQLDDLHQEGKLKLHLVDHNVLPGKDKYLEECVQSVIDHHALERAKDDRVTCEMVGSCSTLVGEVLMQNKDFEITSDLALLLYGTILIDTVNLSEKAGKTTAKDLAVLDVLKSKIFDVDGDELFNKIQEAKMDVSGLSTLDLLEKDLKMTRGTEATISLSSIPVAIKDLCGRTDFKTDMEAFLQSHSADVAIVMSFLDKGEGQLVRELGLYSQDTARVAGLANFMCSSSDPDLGLDLMPEVKALTCYNQKNVKASRKKVLPLVSIYTNKVPGSKVAESTENTETLVNTAVVDNLISLDKPSMDPLVNLSLSGQSSMDLLVNLSPSGQSSMDPFVNLSPISQSTMNPLVNLPPSDQSSMDPLVNLSPTSQSSMNPLVNLSSSGLSSLDPLVNQSKSGQSQMTNNQMSQYLDNSVDTLGDLTEADVMELPRTPDICISRASRCSGNSSEHTSAPGSRFSSYPVTPPNSMMDGSGFNMGRGEHTLPSFNSSEMVRRIQEKKDLLSGSTSHSGSEGNSVPYTPQNSFVDHVFQEHSLPSFNNSDMIQRIQQKRSSMEYGELNVGNGGTGGNLGDFVPFTPQNSYVEGHMDKFLDRSIDAQQLTSQLANVRVLNNKSEQNSNANSSATSPIFSDILRFPVSSSADNSSLMDNGSLNTADHIDKSHDLLSHDFLVDVSYNAKNKPVNVVAAGIAIDMLSDENSDFPHIGDMSHKDDDDQGDKNSRSQDQDSADNHSRQDEGQPETGSRSGPNNTTGQTVPTDEGETVADGNSSHLIMSQKESSEGLLNESQTVSDQIKKSDQFTDPAVNVDIVTEFASSFVNQILDNALTIVSSPSTTFESRVGVTSPFTPFKAESKPGSLPYLLSPVDDSSTTESSDASSTTTEGSYRILSPDNLTTEDTSRVNSPEVPESRATTLESEVYIPSNNFEIRNLTETIIEEENVSEDLEEKNDNILSCSSHEETNSSELPPLQETEVRLQYKQEEDLFGSISNESLSSSSGAKSDIQNGCDTNKVVNESNFCVQGDNSQKSNFSSNPVPELVTEQNKNVPKPCEKGENLEKAEINSATHGELSDKSETSTKINISKDKVKTRKNSNSEKKKHVKSSKPATKKTHMNAKDKLRGIEFTEEWQDDDIPGMPPTEEDEESLSDESSGSRSRHSSESSAGDDIPVRPSSLKTKIAANMNILTEDGLDEGLGPDSIEVLGELEWENDTPVKSPAEPIPQYSAEDESRDAKHWRGVEISGQQHKIDLKVIEPYKKVLSHGGYYGDGLNAIIVFSGCYLPDKSRKDYQYVMDNLFLYVVSTLELLVAEDYMIVYFHGATPRRQMPSFGWLRKCYQMIDRRLRKNLKGLLLVHPTLWLKTIVVMTKPFISAKFTSKLRFVRTLQDLSHLVPMEYIYIPDQVKTYDSNLSQHLAPQTTSVTPAPPVSAL